MIRVRPRLIAITGGSGSGKSWLAGGLQQLLGASAQRVSLDSFYLDRSHLSPLRRSLINYDHPRSIDWDLALHVLEQLKLGRPVRLPDYDFATHSRSAKHRTLAPSPLILVEGLWLLRKPDVRRMFDLSIFLDCPEHRRLEWRTARDVVDRCRTAKSVREQFCATVAPMHKRYVEPQRKYADMVLRQPLDGQAAEQLFNEIWHLMPGHALCPDSRLATLRERARTSLGRAVI